PRPIGAISMRRAEREALSDIAAFADELWLAMARASPDLAAELGVRSVSGVELARDTLPDLSGEGVISRRRVMHEAHREFVRRTAPGDGEGALTHRVLAYLLREGRFGPFAGVDAHRFPENAYPMNHLSGGHAALTMLLSRDQGFASDEDCEGFLARLAQL